MFGIKIRNNTVFVRQDFCNYKYFITASQYPDRLRKPLLFNTPEEAQIFINMCYNHQSGEDIDRDGHIDTPDIRSSVCGHPIDNYIIYEITE